MLLKLCNLIGTFATLLAVPLNVCYSSVVKLSISSDMLMFTKSDGYLAYLSIVSLIWITTKAFNSAHDTYSKFKGKEKKNADRL
ncbi:hypothetical protein [Aureibacter tunicatorum]|uniref:Uncharacterized protein n=1 Tax=Aureibacter tunicatorum TaxID=866807 RepID=A0AAE4BS88_9BACT|nr:hypothetical protein [Aureibacter tunicatorum]MDR6240969.1 hypothetical protein [Aureibacter tunicatorum]BDD03749.1 hypothetical protein AUTU_12320 [Aureibacter tunicatorum]